MPGLAAARARDPHVGPLSPPPPRMRRRSTKFTDWSPDTIVIARPAMAIRLTADWVVPMDGPPLAEAGVLIDRHGDVVAMGPAHALPRPADCPSEHARGVLLPGLINLHTHLELTGLESPAPPEDFPTWIRELRARKAARAPADFAAAAREGIRQALAAGVTAVADTGDSGAVLPALAAAGLSGVVYQEVFGPHPGQLEASLAALRATLDRLAPHQSATLRLGLSPHAPYTVSGPLYRAAARLAADLGLPVAVHLAESRAESALVTAGSGPFADAWRGRGIPLPAEQGAGLPAEARRSPVAWLDAHGVLGPRTLAIHAVQVDPADAALLAARGVAVAHCPLSNARHGHGAAPLRLLLDQGVAVGVGTDSELSVGRPDLLAELRAARALAGLGAPAALALATTAAAAALGLEGRLGRLGIGARGDAVVVDTAVRPGEAPEEAVLRSGPEDVALTVVAGRVAWRRAGAA